MTTTPDRIAQREAYLARFATFSPEEQRRHLMIGIAWLVRMLEKRAQPLALDVDVVDGEYTVRDE